MVMKDLSPRPKRILVLWANSSANNLGVRALGEGAVQLARMAFPGAEISTHGTGGEHLPGNDGPVKALRWTSIAKSLVIKKAEVLRWLRSFDLILDTRAGDSFTDIYGTKRLRQMSMLPLLARSIGVPVVLAPQTIGPFQTRQGRAIARTVMSRMDLVLARDSTSFDVAARYRVRRPPVQATDVAFALERPEVPTRYDVLLNVSGLLWDPNPHVDHLQYRALLGELYEGLVERGRTVTLLEHVLHHPGATGDTDRPACEAFRSLHDPSMQVVGPESLEDVRVAVASARLVLGARMHASLNSLSVGTPTIPMAYSRKFAPLFDAIGWHYTVDLGSAEVEEVLAIVDTEGLDEAAKRSRERARDALNSAAIALRGVL